MCLQVEEIGPAGELTGLRGWSGRCVVKEMRVGGL